MVARAWLLVTLLGGFTVWAAETNEAVFRLGIDVLAQRGFRDLKGKRVGLVTNPSGGYR